MLENLCSLKLKGFIMYNVPDNICTAPDCGKPKSRDKFCCGRKKCLEYFRSFPNGKGYSMIRYESESGVSVHKLGIKVTLLGGVYDT
jgi:hypothetical protein